MLRLTLLVVSVAVSHSFAVAADLPLKISRGLDAAKAAYTIESDAAKQEMLASFAEATDRLRQTPKVSDAELAAGIETIAREKARFEKTGRIPFSNMLRASTITYLKRVHKADSALAAWYDKAIAHHIRAKNDTEALTFKAEKEKVLTPPLIGTIQRLDHGFEWPLRSDGTADGSRTWTLDTRFFVLKYHDPKTPTVLTYTCVSHPNGLDFDCVSNDGGKFRAKLID